MDSGPLKDRFPTLFDQRLEQSQKLNSPLPLVCTREIKNVNPLSWLAAQHDYPKLYWQNRKRSLTMAGVGIGFKIDLFNEVLRGTSYWREIINTTSIDKSFLFYVQAFDPLTGPGSDWSGRGLNQVLIPRRFIIDDGIYLYHGFSGTVIPETDLKYFSNELKRSESTKLETVNRW